MLPLFLLVLIWLLALSHYSRLPAELPARFVPWGVPVDWAPKSPALFVLPGTALLIELVLRFVGMIAIARPVVDGRPLEGLAARGVGRLLARYLFLMRTALLAWLLNLEFRIIQIAYGARDSLGWDSYLVAGMVAVYGVAGAWLLLRGARRLAAASVRDD